MMAAEHARALFPPDGKLAEPFAGLGTVKRLQLQLEEAEDELRKAHERIEQQKVHITSLKGQRTALRLGSEEATARGESWDIVDVKRFSALPKGPGDFTSEVLRELVDQALVATKRRVAEAVAEGSKIRAECAKAAAEGEQSLEQAYARCTGLTAAEEHGVRQATKAVLVRGSRLTSKLCKSVKQLEDEGRAAMTLHATDMHSLAARLLAQRNAFQTVLTNELAQCEYNDLISIHGLQAELRTARAALQSSDGEVGKLRGIIAETQRQLQAEKISRSYDNTTLTESLGLLKREVADLERQLAIAERERATNGPCLRYELSREERAHDSDNKQLHSMLSAAAAEHAAMAAAHEQQIRAMRKVERRSLEQMATRIKALDAEKQVLELQLTQQIQMAESDFERERRFMKSKIEKQGEQVTALKASTSRGRAMFYWSSMKKRPSGHGKPDDEADEFGSPIPDWDAVAIGDGQPLPQPDYVDHSVGRRALDFGQRVTAHGAALGDEADSGGPYNGANPDGNWLGWSTGTDRLKTRASG